MTLPPILVTGGTGTLGQQVVARLAEAGREVRVLSRRSATKTSQEGPAFVTGDLATGAGLPAAVHGVGTIVHCASSRKGDAEATRNLVRTAAQEKEPPHLVYISIVGVDRFPRGYYKAKLAAEAIIAGSGLPWTTLRATQFYELIRSGAQRLAKLPVIPVPAGFSDGIRMYLTATGRRAKPVVPVWIPGIGPIRAGALYPPPGSDASIGHRTWPEFLGAKQGLPSLCVSAVTRCDTVVVGPEPWTGEDQG